MKYSKPKARESRSRLCEIEKELKEHHEIFDVESQENFPSPFVQYTESNFRNFVYFHAAQMFRNMEIISMFFYAVHMWRNVFWELYFSCGTDVKEQKHFTHLNFMHDSCKNTLRRFCQNNVVTPGNGICKISTIH